MHLTRSLGSMPGFLSGNIQCIPLLHSVPAIPPSPQVIQLSHFLHDAPHEKPWINAWFLGGSIQFPSLCAGFGHGYLYSCIALMCHKFCSNFFCRSIAGWQFFCQHDRLPALLAGYLHLAVSSHTNSSCHSHLLRLVGIMKIALRSSNKVTWQVQMWRVVCTCLGLLLCFICAPLLLLALVMTCIFGTHSAVTFLSWIYHVKFRLYKYKPTQLLSNHHFSNGTHSRLRNADSSPHVQDPSLDSQPTGRSGSAQQCSRARPTSENFDLNVTDEDDAGQDNGPPVWSTGCTQTTAVTEVKINDPSDFKQEGKKESVYVYFFRLKTKNLADKRKCKECE